MKKPVMVFLCVAAVGLGLAACAGSGTEVRKAGQQLVAKVDPDGVQRVSILGGSYFFTPSSVTVKVNRPVEVTVRADSASEPHSFVIKAPEAGMDVDQDFSTEPAVVRFTPTKVGAYTFYCDEKSPSSETHRSKGMAGVLQVVE
jgi:plastocyanin domain-containing protein